MDLALLREYFTLEGRRRRVSFVLVNIAVTILSMIAATLLGTLPDTVGSALYLALNLAALAVNVCMVAQRLHDMDASGWWALLVAVPVVNLAFIAFLCLWPGTGEANRYGPAPADGNRHVPNHPKLFWEFSDRKSR